MSDDRCIDCDKRIKANVAERKPSVIRCYKCHCVHEARGHHFMKDYFSQKRRADGETKIQKEIRPNM